MSYQIITDSCCDFTEQQYADFGVSYAPLTVLYKGVEHKNFNDEAILKEFYESLRQGETATTSAVNPEGWAQVMEAALKAGKDVLCLAFPSG